MPRPPIGAERVVSRSRRAGGVGAISVVWAEQGRTTRRLDDLWPCPFCHSLNVRSARRCYKCREKRPPPDAVVAPLLRWRALDQRGSGGAAREPGARAAHPARARRRPASPAPATRPPGRPSSGGGRATLRSPRRRWRRAMPLATVGARSGPGARAERRHPARGWTTTGTTLQPMPPATLVADDDDLTAAAEAEPEPGPEPEARAIPSRLLRSSPPCRHSTRFPGGVRSGRVRPRKRRLRSVLRPLSTFGRSSPIPAGSPRSHPSRNHAGRSGSWRWPWPASRCSRWSSWWAARCWRREARPVSDRARPRRCQGSTVGPSPTITVHTLR